MSINISNPSTTAKDEGNALTTDPANINFVGAGVTATVSNGTVTVTVPATAVGAASSTDEAVARFDGTAGTTLQNSVVTISDAGLMKTHSIEPAADSTYDAGTTTAWFLATRAISNLTSNVKSYGSDALTISAGGGDVSGSGVLTVKSNDDAGSTGAVTIRSGDSSGSDTGALTIKTGDASGESGALTITTGSGGAGRGSLSLSGNGVGITSDSGVVDASGSVVRVATPVGTTDAATKAYVDGTRVSSVLTTRVTDAPNATGEYRTYKKDAGANTGTNEAPTVGPSSTNGMRIYAKNYATAGDSGQTNRWEIYVGTNKKVKFEFYLTTGFQGGLMTDVHYYGTTVLFGVMTQYDPTTGIALVDCIEQAAAVTSRVVGSSFANAGAAPNNPTDCYFDILYS